MNVPVKLRLSSVFSTVCTDRKSIITKMKDDVDVDVDVDER